jgi:protein-histidine pros-kinase
MLVENAGDGILLMDPTTQVCLDGNPALLAMLGLEHDEIVGKLAVELIAPDELSRRPLDNSTLLREGRSVVERSLVTKRGEVLSVEAHASMLPGGLVQVIVRDLSERKRAEAMRARERGRLAELLEAAPDAVIVADHVGRVVLVNEQTRRLFGYPGEELLGVEVEQLLPQSRRADHVHARAAYVAEPSTRPMGAGRPSPGRRKDGSEFPAEVSLATIENEDGPLVLAFIRDVTERERREQAEREFIANAAHELRTPLAGIAGAVEALQLGASEIPAKRERFLEGIARETSRMTALVRALLLLARAQGDPESISRERVEVAPLLVETARRLELAPGVGVDVECTADLVILANRPLLEAAIGNLAQNASRHTSRGSITLAARVAPGAVSIEVRDTGEGMSDEVQARVFERFYRAGGDREGFGLGLPLVREMVRVLDGELELESQSQRGTTVRMIVPHLT